MAETYRVCAAVNFLGGPYDYYSVQTPWHGALLIECLAQSYILDPSVHDSMFWLEVCTDPDATDDELWQTWEDEEGDGVQDSFGEYPYLAFANVP